MRCNVRRQSKWNSPSGARRRECAGFHDVHERVCRWRLRDGHEVICLIRPFSPLLFSTCQSAGTAEADGKGASPDPKLFMLVLPRRPDWPPLKIAGSINADRLPVAPAGVRKVETLVLYATVVVVKQGPPGPNVHVRVGTMLEHFRPMVL